MITELWLQLSDLGRQLMRPSGQAAWAVDLRTLPAAMRWALPWAILGRVSRDASPMRWVEYWAKRRPNAVAIADASRRLTFVELRDESRRLAESLRARGVIAGQRVAVTLPPSTELVLGLVGCWNLGAVPCPLDPDTPESIGRDTLQRLEPDWVITKPQAGASEEQADRTDPCRAGAQPIGSKARVPTDPKDPEWKIVKAPSRTLDEDSGHDDPKWQSNSTLSGGREVSGSAKGPTSFLARRPMAASTLALVLPTSGTAGAVKLCRITAGRLAFSGHAFGGLALGCRSRDVIYCPLPLHHATAITVGLMPALVHGVTLHLAGRFSASRFWNDLRAAGATQLLYVGDLLRYAMTSVDPTSRDKDSAKPQRDDDGTKTARDDGAEMRCLRCAVGNGLDPSTWRSVTERWPALRIVEFYGATEAPSALLNFSGKIGSLGRVPLRRLSRYIAVRPSNDGECREPPISHDESPFSGDPGWTPCMPGEVGELWIRIPRRRWPWLGDFEGYLAPSATRDGEPERARHPGVVKNVFRRGDRYYRTSDLVRYDDDDYLYFVDRLGDVWRNKGHNVSTVWLAGELRSVTGIEDALVVPVALDDSPRRLGLAVVVTSGSAWRAALEAKLRTLPSYARPHFVQIVRELPKTATHKPNKNPWRSRRWTPNAADGGECYEWNDGLRVVPVTRDPA